MAAKTPPSPDGLVVRGAPLTSARLSPKAAFGAVAVLAAMLGFIIVNVSKEKPKPTAQEREAAELKPALAAAKTLTMDVPDIADTSKPIALPAVPAASTLPPITRPQERVSKKSAPSSEELARMAGTEIAAFASSEMPHAASGAAQAANVSGFVEPASTALRAVSALAGNGDPANEPDLNRQLDKVAFLQESRESGYLDRQLTAPRSSFELKTGTVIPGVLLSELNSDLPGEIVAQVAHNVYDTASGNHLLIPQGTKLFGHYDSRVAFGQGRLLVSWQRLIFPDASTLELDGMGGYDRGGNAGFTGRVNNHYGRLFGFALLTSAISAGYQISQPDRDSTLTPLSEQQVAAAAVGQQMAQLGTEIARRNMRVQPTITVAKGYRLHVMVNKDIVFPGSYQR